MLSKFVARHVQRQVGRLTMAYLAIKYSNAHTKHTGRLTIAITVTTVGI